jgi:hypothetical protein
MFIAMLTVGFVVLWVLAERTSTQQVTTGTVAEVHSGEWMLVADPGMRLPVALRETTTYEGNPADLKPGMVR